MAELIGPDRVAVVTGAASGIGRALAEAFVAAGSSAVLADVDGEGVRAAADALRAAGGAVEAVTVDVSDPSSVEALAATTVERFGRVDVLCNNAGVSTFNLIQDQTIEDWHWVFDVNLWGVVHGIRAFLPILSAQSHRSHIVNTSSMGGLMGGLAFIGPYAATKAAVVSLSESLHQELAAYGQPIGVSVLCPTVTDTKVLDSERVRPSARGVEQRSDDAEAMRLAIGELCVGPDGMTPEQVATRTLEAIANGEFWILPGGGERPIIEARATDILDSFPS